MIPRSAPSGSTGPSVSDPIEVAMEEALRPGRYMSEHASLWSHFTRLLTICSYQVLMELVPESARAIWHDKAIEAAVQSGAPLSVVLPLLVDTREVRRLAGAIDRCADDHLSHAGYRAVEAAEALDEPYPEQAARL
jgi:hypothetical protein